MPPFLYLRYACCAGEATDLAGSALHWQPAETHLPVLSSQPTREALRLKVVGEKEKGLGKQVGNSRNLDCNCTSLQ